MVISFPHIQDSNGRKRDCGISRTLSSSHDSVTVLVAKPTHRYSLLGNFSTRALSLLILVTFF